MVLNVALFCNPLPLRCLSRPEKPAPSAAAPTVLDAALLLAQNTPTTMWSTTTTNRKWSKESGAWRTKQRAIKLKAEKSFKRIGYKIVDNGTPKRVAKEERKELSEKEGFKFNSDGDHT